MGEWKSIIFAKVRMNVKFKSILKGLYIFH